MCDGFLNQLKIMMSIEISVCDRTKSPASKNLSGKALILIGHCSLSGRYFEP